MTEPSINDTYVSPLVGRYASKEMQAIWSPRRKFELWRKIWLAAAEAQHAVGLPVTQEQVDELRANLDVTDADIARAAELEAELRHDVMAHVHAWGERCPKAKPIIHLGMTSQDVNDNCELELLYESCRLIERQSQQLIIALAGEADRTRTIPCLGFTHYQPAQPVTVGRRLVQYAHDLLEGTDRVSEAVSRRPSRGLRGATGTQASYLKLCDGDADRVDLLEGAFLERWAHDGQYRTVTSMSKDELRSALDQELEETKMLSQYLENFPLRDEFDEDGDTLNGAWAAELERMTTDDYRHHVAQDHSKHRTFQLVTQTYPRVHDAEIVSSLASICAVLHKTATDIRLLCNRKELDEPFADKQIGSSAMPYKRNPMRCERVCGLARFVMNLVGNAYETAATQWLERTLDDSSNRRVVLPEAFLATEACLNIMTNVIDGLVVHEATVRKNLMAELPFLATENIMMEAVKRGGDRQDLHERIRVHAQAAGHRVKHEGFDNDLIERLRNDDAFASIHDLLDENKQGGLLDPMNYIGLAVEQTERFLRDVIDPLREHTDRDDDDRNTPADLNV